MPECFSVPLVQDGIPGSDQNGFAVLANNLADDGVPLVDLLVQLVPRHRPRDLPALHLLADVLPELRPVDVLHRLPVLFARFFGEVSRFDWPMIDLTMLGLHAPMRDIFLANGANQSKVDDRRGLSRNKRRYLALVRTRQDIVEEGLLYPKAPRRVRGATPELRVGVEIPTHVDGDFILRRPLYRVQKLSREFQSLPAPIQTDEENVLHVGLADVPDPHGHVSPCKLITGSYLGVGVVVDYCARRLLGIRGLELDALRRRVAAQPAHLAPDHVGLLDKTDPGPAFVRPLLQPRLQLHRLRSSST